MQYSKSQSEMHAVQLLSVFGSTVIGGLVVSTVCIYVACYKVVACRNKLSRSKA